MTIHIGVEWLQGLAAIALLIGTAISVGMVYNKAQKESVCNRPAAARNLKIAAWLGVALLFFYAFLGCSYLVAWVSARV